MLRSVIVFGMSAANEQKEQSHVLMLTVKAFNKIYELLQEVGEDHTLLRVYIQGGGCAGFEYGFEFDQNIAADDWLMRHALAGDSIDAETLKVASIQQSDIHSGPSYQQEKAIYVIIDAFSYPLLQGSTLDYVDDDPAGSRFIFKNPKAKRTCGCGASFST